MCISNPTKLKKSTANIKLTNTFCQLGEWWTHFSPGVSRSQSNALQSPKTTKLALPLYLHDKMAWQGTIEGPYYACSDFESKVMSHRLMSPNLLRPSERLSTFEHDRRGARKWPSLTRNVPLVILKA